MWRRELIRIVLAGNWIVFAVSCGMAVHGHNSAWTYASQELAVGEIEDRGDKLEDATREEIQRRMAVLGPRTEPLRKSGESGWGLACLASLGTAVLLMVAFPKGTE